LRTKTSVPPPGLLSPQSVSVPDIEILYKTVTSQINEALQIVYMLEFKRSTDKDEGFLDVKEAEADEQHKSIIGALKAAAPKWEFEQINFVVGNRGSVVESDFYTKLKKLDVQEGKKDKLFADHVTQVCEAHNRVIVSFLQQVQGGTRPTTEGSRKNIGHNVHV